MIARTQKRMGVRDLPNYPSAAIRFELASVNKGAPGRTYTHATRTNTPRPNCRPGAMIVRK